jgi:hypothetical protein
LFRKWNSTFFHYFKYGRHPYIHIYIRELEPFSLSFRNKCFFGFYFSLVSVFFKLLCWIGVHCGIYTDFYNIPNISYLNSLPPTFSFIPTPHWKNTLNRHIFSIYIHVYIVITLYSPSYTLSSPSSPPISNTPSTPSWDLLWFSN